MEDFDAICKHSLGVDELELRVQSPEGTLHCSDEEEGVSTADGETGNVSLAGENPARNRKCSMV